MKKGFVGRAANSYFAKVDEALSKGEAGINKGKTFASSGVLRTISGDEKATATYQGYSNRLLNATDKLMENQSVRTVLVDEEKYAYLSQKALTTDNIMSEKIYYVILQLKQMCEEDYKIPSATPKVVQYLEDLENTLGDFIHLSESIKGKVDSFVSAIDEADY